MGTRISMQGRELKTAQKSVTKLGEDWDFAEADIHYMSHGLHPYPARMIPQVASKLIELYAPKDLEPRKQLVLDPFCGSGGVLVESLLTGRNAIGIDINPLACLIARVKTTPLDPALLTNTWEKLRKDMSIALRFERRKVPIPDFRDVNIGYWFKDYVIEDLALIKSFLDSISDLKLRDFFYVCFSRTVRQVSGTRKGEFKLYRIPEEEWKEYKPDVFDVFQNIVNNAISKMGEFYEAVSKLELIPKVEVLEADTRDILTDKFPEEASKKLKENSVHLIVTSPPYGDSHTTVAYGQFSKYSLIWLGYSKERTLEIDKQSIGGRRNGEDIRSKTLQNIVSQIKSEHRAREVKDFFVDLNKTLERLVKVLVKDAHACFVLGNRTVNGIKIPTDEILVELGKEFGLEKTAVVHRRIPSKRIPWKSSPTNVPGQKVDTIAKENIVILRKT